MFYLDLLGRMHRLSECAGGSRRDHLLVFCFFFLFSSFFVSLSSSSFSSSRYALSYVNRKHFVIWYTLAIDGTRTCATAHTRNASLVLGLYAFIPPISLFLSLLLRVFRINPKIFCQLDESVRVEKDLDSCIRGRASMFSIRLDVFPLFPKSSNSRYRPSIIDDNKESFPFRIRSTLSTFQSKRRINKWNRPSRVKSYSMIDEKRLEYSSSIFEQRSLPLSLSFSLPLIILTVVVPRSPKHGNGFPRISSPSSPPLSLSTQRETRIAHSRHECFASRVQPRDSSICHRVLPILAELSREHLRPILVVHAAMAVAIAV